MKLGCLVPPDKAKEMGSWNKIVTGNGNDSNAIGRDKIRKCLDGVTDGGMDPCWDSQQMSPW